MSGPNERDEVAADREALIDALYADKDLGPGYMLRDDCEHLADRFLASTWLAERDRRTAVTAWDEGYETGRDDERFDQRGLSTDSDADEYPHANPHRRVKAVRRDRGPRCGECRLGLGVHEPRDPQCAWHKADQ